MRTMSLPIIIGFSLVCAALLGGSALVSNLVNADVVGADNSRHQILTERLNIANELLRSLVDLQARGQVSADTPAVTTWLHRAIQAQREAASEKRQLVLAFQQNVELMKKNLIAVEALHRNGAATKNAVLDARYGLLEAQLALTQEPAPN